MGVSTVLNKVCSSAQWKLNRNNTNPKKWEICIDLKLLNFLLGKLGGYKNNPGFIYHSDGSFRDQCSKKVTVRDVSIQGQANLMKKASIKNLSSITH